MTKKFYLCLVAVLFCVQSAFAAMPINDDEEVIRSANEGIEQFQQGHYSEAASSFDYAAQLARQKRGGDLKNYLPQALPGWTKEDGESQAMGGAMFGGMTSTSASYSKGDSRIEITIVADSPLMQSVMMMFSNPMFAVADGGRIQTINGQKAIVKYDAATKDGDVKVVAGQVLVTVEGSGVVFEDLMQYTSAVPFDQLQS